MKIRLYLDEDAMDDDLVDALRDRRVDVETVDEVGMRVHPDRDHLIYATAQGRVVYIFNAGHFCALHADFLTRGESHAGIVVSQQQRCGVGEHQGTIHKQLQRHHRAPRQSRKFVRGNPEPLTWLSF